VPRCPPGHARPKTRSQLCANSNRAGGKQLPRQIEQFWLDILALPRHRLCPSVVNVYSKYSQKKRRNKLPYGTCRLVVHDTRIVQSIFGSIQEYGGFERPEWLG
jgi:hypothetical protein